MEQSDLSRSLRERVQAIIAKMSTLSEAPAQRIDPTRGSQTKPTDKEPPGTNHRRGDRPDPDDRLLDWYLWAVKQARSEHVVLAYTIEAEYRYELRAKSKGLEWNAGAVNVSATVSSKDRDKRIVTEYTGIPAEAVAVIESMKGGGFVTAANVRRVRQMKERDGETGDHAPKLNAVERDERLLAMFEADVSKRRMAKAFGVSPQTITNWLKRLGLPDGTV